MFILLSLLTASRVTNNIFLLSLTIGRHLDRSTSDSDSTFDNVRVGPSDFRTSDAENMNNWLRTSDIRNFNVRLEQSELEHSFQDPVSTYES